MGKKKTKDVSGIVIALPKEDVAVLLEALEDRLDDINESECDCDDCVNAIAVIGSIVENIFKVAPLEGK
jgi:hypothetical protein